MENSHKWVLLLSSTNIKTYRTVNLLNNKVNVSEIYVEVNQSRPSANWTNCFQLGPALREPHTEAIYFQLFKYTQQHTGGFTENNIETLLRPALKSITTEVLLKKTIYCLLLDSYCRHHIFLGTIRPPP